MARLGSSISVFDFFQLGSSMSLRGFARLGSGLSVVSQLTVGSLYITESSNSFVFTVGSGSKALTLSTDGGVLHGSWSAESAVVTSDRRLKKEIVPLQRTLRDVAKKRWPLASGGKATNGNPLSSASAKKDGNEISAKSEGDGAIWLLRQLRPVSYSFRKGRESKYMRFGFVADELESVLPQVVRSVGNQEVEDQKAVVYQDLIALLAAGIQSQQHRIEMLEGALERSQRRSLEDAMQFKEMREKMEQLEQRLQAQETEKSLRGKMEQLEQRLRTLEAV
jgi:hypothetical protein